MEKKTWKKPEKRKNEKHVCVCQSCCKLSTDKGMKEEMYYLVDSGDHRSIHCIDCIEKKDLKISAPYKEPRKKRVSKKTSE